MRPGDYAQFVGLRRNPEMNGKYVEIRTELVENEVPEEDGAVRLAHRYGVSVIGSGKTGYVRPENLLQVAFTEPEKRAVRIHVTGWE